MSTSSFTNILPTSKQADSDEYSFFPLIYAVLFSFSTRVMKLKIDWSLKRFEKNYKIMIYCAQIILPYMFVSNIEHV